MGLLRSIEAVVTLSFAFPAVLLGVESLLAGQQVGWVFLALAAVAVGMTVLVDTPADWVAGAGDRVVGRIGNDEE